MCSHVLKQCNVILFAKRCLTTNKTSLHHLNINTVPCFGYALFCFLFGKDLKTSLLASGLLKRDLVWKDVK